MMDDPTFTLWQRVERLERRLHNLLLLGTIEAADYAAARVRARIGDLVTGWLPYLTQRAGGDITWHAPEVGEQVVVLSPSGELAGAVVLPALYQAAHPAPAAVADRRVTTYLDGAAIAYDRTAHHLSAILPAGATAALVADGGITMTGNVAITGDITVTGKITTSGDVVAAGISLDHHTHPDAQGGMTGAPS